MPDCCVNEPLPHLLKAEKDESDEPAPFVWVYPMKEYTTSEDETELKNMYFGDKYICDVINDGFPLNCVVSTDNFLKHDISLYQKSVLISPVPTNKAVSDRLVEFAENGVRVIIYGDNFENCTLTGGENIDIVNISEGSKRLFIAAEKFGYSIINERRDEKAKVPAIAVSRHNNGTYFSVYNPNTTTKTKLRFPLGAPILMCCETELENGYATYNFSRCEHRECRIFVKQDSGVISAREATAACAKYRRRIKITGLKDATVCYFSESYSKDCAAVGPVPENYNMKPILDERFKVVHDPQNGTYIKGEHISGDIFCFMPTRREW